VMWVRAFCSASIMMVSATLPAFFCSASSIFKSWA
jgi:hypothetical protein